MTTKSPTLGDATIQELREAVRGEVVAPGDDGYDESRAVWNGDIDRKPALIVRCSGAADVMAGLRFARSEDLEVAVRGGAHNVAGFATTDGGLVLDLSEMNAVSVDPEAKLARVQGGAVWADVDHETQAFGLATTGGLVSSTGVAGFTLGGGIGWLMRNHGLAADNLVAADVVTADGEMVRADDNNPELLWGLRGGGGNFGVVTSFEFSLHPVGPLVYGGAIFHRAERAKELLEFYADWVEDMSDELTTLVVFMTAPPEPFVPEELVGSPMVAVAACHTGNHADAEAALEPLRAFAPAEIDLLGPIPYVALQGMFDNSAPHGIHAYWKTAYLDELSSETIDTIVEGCEGLTGLSPFSAFHLHHVGGAAGRIDPSATAFPHRSRPFVLNTVGLWMAEEPRDPHVNWVRETWDALQAAGAAEPYLNFLADEGQDSVEAAYGEETYQRLADLKKRYDPANVFHLNQNIKPE